MLLDKDLGRDYVVMSEKPASLCSENARVAAEHGRFDHARIWTTLHKLFCPTVPPLDLSTQADPPDEKGQYELIKHDRGHVRWGDQPLAKQTVQGLCVPKALTISSLSLNHPSVQLRRFREETRSANAGYAVPDPSRGRPLDPFTT